MPLRKLLALLLCGLAAIGAVYGALLVHRGFSARDEPSWPERVIARAVRNLAIPRHAAREANPWTATPDNPKEAREIFMAPCARRSSPRILDHGRGLEFETPRAYDFFQSLTFSHLAPRGQENG
ncbi:MAG TPA: hypothetical protein VFF64_02025 [Candidatus Eremiobacteraceae bacterium]|nr:hypothetical protein [Candidatus Eremiobacteraceae bacterium]